jgi:dTDP-4-dehydrorhamnose reductase|tara:strand:- start:409 stop:1194 length:786 start_codon:yes stop_codon:yes gene_type:complete
MRNVLVTGSNGQLGKTINELFSKNEDNLDFTFVSREDLDITKTTDLNEFFKINFFDYCINCAAYTNVEQAEKTPEIAYRVNSEGVKSLAKSCKEANIVLIHISTDYVFDGEKKEPYTVNDLPNPINEYGKSKFLGEQFVQETMDRYFIIRTSWLYSKKHGHNFYRTILKKTKTQKEIPVTITQIGCPTDTVNLSKYIINLVKSISENYGIKHFCDQKIMTWYDFAKQILNDNSLTNIITPVAIYDSIASAKRPKYSNIENT